MSLPFSNFERTWLAEYRESTRVSNQMRGFTTVGCHFRKKRGGYTLIHGYNILVLSQEAEK